MRSKLKLNGQDMKEQLEKLSPLRLFSLFGFR